ncbi:DUF3027 domain-containing protein, partial [Actinomadura sp. NPDC049753]|uniref:DUF3027 domain-containing protein n=1 Tax=Actinomadura sp. NPDC049753 TaxID=3154739 RepID=UPI0034195C3F
PAYVGWRWAVTVTRASRAKNVTVSECVLLPGGWTQVVGAENVAGQAIRFRRTARGQVMHALVNGTAGIVWFEDGRPQSVLAFTVAEGRVTAIDILADPDRLAALDLVYSG